MSLTWQYILMGLILALALGFLVWHFIRGRRQRKACGDCALRKMVQQPKNNGEPNRS